MTHLCDTFHDAPDGTVLISFTIPGRAATKKNHQRVVKRGGFTKVLPSVQYEAYETHTRPFLEAIAETLGRPIDFGVAVRMTVTLNNWVVGDHCGYLQSIGDLLEKHGVIANDALINWVGYPFTPWLGPPDKEHPRVEITILRSRHPKELRK